MEAVNNSQTKSRNLGFVVRCNFLKTALIPILAVELVLLGLYLLSHHHILEKNLDLLRANALETISEISVTEAKNIDDQLIEINRNNTSLQAENQALFTYSLAKNSLFSGRQLKMNSVLATGLATQVFLFHQRQI